LAPRHGGGGVCGVPGSAAAGRGRHSTRKRATFTFSRCTVQEAVIQSLHQLSRSEGKAKEEEEEKQTRESFYFFFLLPYVSKTRITSESGHPVTRSPLRILFFPSERTSFALLRDSLSLSLLSFFPAAHYSLTASLLSSDSSICPGTTPTKPPTTPTARKRASRFKLHKLSLGRQQGSGAAVAAAAAAATAAAESGPVAAGAIAGLPRSSSSSYSSSSPSSWTLQ